MKGYYLILLLVVYAAAAGAQDKAPSPWRFHSINTMGVISGKSETRFQLQTINGVRKDHLLLGLGVGMDNYRYSGIPVFIDTRYYTSRLPSSFFGYADGGIHFPTRDKAAKVYDQKYLPGLYTDIGVGYAFECGRHSAVEMSAGWTYKRVTTEHSAWVTPVGAPPYQNIDRYIYDLTRLVFKAGFRF